MCYFLLPNFVWHCYVSREREEDFWCISMHKYAYTLVSNNLFWHPVVSTTATWTTTWTCKIELALNTEKCQSFSERQKRTRCQTNKVERIANSRSLKKDYLIGTQTIHLYYYLLIDNKGMNAEDMKPCNLMYRSDTSEQTNHNLHCFL